MRRTPPYNYVLPKAPTRKANARAFVNTCPLATRLIIIQITKRLYKRFNSLIISFQVLCVCFYCISLFSFKPPYFLFKFVTNNRNSMLSWECIKTL